MQKKKKRHGHVPPMSRVFCKNDAKSHEIINLAFTLNSIREMIHAVKLRKNVGNGRHWTCSPADL